MRFLYILSILAVVTVATSSKNPGKLTVTSTSFASNGMIPTKYTCQGEQVSPPLNVAGIPPGAKSLAIILHDPDADMAGGFTHWVVWNIATDGNIPENFKGAVQGLNGARKAGYIGMCPPSGVHHYHFMVYALDSRLAIDKATDKGGLEKAMAGHILARGELIGLYEKSK